jgi:hypothetical protein
MEVLAPYRKTVAAIVVGLIGWATVVVTSETSKITAPEWIGLATAVATALGVYTVPNTPERKK